MVRVRLVVSIALLWLGASPSLHALRTSPQLPHLHAQEPLHDQCHLEVDLVVFEYQCTCSEKPVYRRMVIAISGMRFYNPTTGMWISRDPIGEQGGLNLYGFVGNDPVSYYDFLGLKKYGVVCSMASELRDTIKRVSTVDRSDLRLRFLKTQQCILDRLCEGKCCQSDSDAKWLNSTVERFMGNLLRAIAGEFDESNSVWKDAFEEIDDRELALRLGRGVGPGNAAGLVGQLLLNEGLASSTMVLVHINNDLRQALRESGIGTDPSWKCIGDIVDSCSNEHFSSIELFAGDVFFGQNVSDIRDSMREEVRNERSRLR